ncbi:MAG: hypothetical protein QM446_09265, partial [Synergistota bacterium]|nr:hypothetical protein [Synergistota bacterium]
QTLLYGFEQVLTSNSFKSFVDKRETVMSMDWRFTPLNESSLLVEAIIGSLKNIARDYPEHVRILEVQVNEQDF